MQRIACMVLAVAALHTSGCVYLELSLGKQPSAKQRPDEAQGPPESRLPKTADAEKRRRARRSKWALLAAPAELAAGAAITYLALYGSSDDANSSSDGVVGGLKDNAENSLGRAVAGAFGLVALASGTADLVLGGTGYVLPSPFVAKGDDGKPRMLAVSELASSPPMNAPQMDAGGGGHVGLRGLGFDFDLGIFHWLSPRIRLRYSLGAGYEIAALDRWRVDPPVDGDERAQLFGILSATVRGDIEMRRRHHWGRYPGVSLCFAASGRAAWSEAGDRFHGWLLGAGLGYRGQTILFSVSQLHDRDRYPIPGLVVLGSFETD